jgi:hypothetical protein
MTMTAPIRHAQRSVWERANISKADVACGIFMGFAINLFTSRHFGDSIGFVRKIYQIAAGIFKTDPNKLVKLLHIATARRMGQGFEIPEGLSSQPIALSNCPFREFDQQMITLHGGQTSAPYIEFFEEGIVFPIVEAILVQQALRHDILYTGVRKVIKKVAPRYTYCMDLMAVHIFRVFVTAVLYAVYRSSTQSYRSLVVDVKEDEFYHAFMLSIVLGCANGLSERPFAIMVHIINNVFLFCMRQIPRC